ncbi:hypothetical protein AB3M93_16735 [Novosphingobium panipatense]|uniref:hypothetical protein n=1 Tax=Novosphingobium TaxID=165696 RepID=UPI000CDB8152|nr:hypothetical protein [Novosphingobium sp. HII-3]
MTTHSKREFLAGGGMLMAMMGLAHHADAAAGPGPVRPLPGQGFPMEFKGTGDPMPWIRRVFHLYSGSDGLTRAEQLEVIDPRGQEIATLLRRTAERVTLGGSQPNAGFGFHVANQPTLLIPLFGAMIIGLHDGTEHVLQHGDLAYAEDCTGQGHISKAGPEGSFMVAVQLPRSGCPRVGSSDMGAVWSEPAPAN